MDGLRAETDPLRPNWITSQASQTLVHKWRSQEPAILVGTRTALNDNPELTVRKWHGKNPVRVLIDRTLRIPRHYKLFDRTVKTLVFTEKNKMAENNVEYIQIDFSSYVVQQLLNELYKRSIQSVIIEGGAATLDAFIENNLWDEARVLIGNKTFGQGLKAPILNKNLHSDQKIGEDRLLIYFNTSWT
jgi:diaminohydroxyphosphoribosylaminopyrimidine deaminase/5-amino-6-(5-phosphoribosylamino)uracil reductase